MDTHVVTEAARATLEAPPFRRWSGGSLETGRSVLPGGLRRCRTILWNFRGCRDDAHSLRGLPRSPPLPDLAVARPSPTASGITSPIVGRIRRAIQGGRPKGYHAFLRGRRVTYWDAAETNIPSGFQGRAGHSLIPLDGRRGRIRKFAFLPDRLLGTRSEQRRS